MNLLHMKYAVEVAETGSINRAAERLMIGQPNLSRAIKDLEASLGIKIFERSAKGMSLTSEGETFLDHAKSILEQVDEVEETFKKTYSAPKQFSISVPRASYISEAFARFSNLLDSGSESEIFYKETNSSRAISNVTKEDYSLGIIRYSEEQDRYYKTALDAKGLDYEIIAEFRYKLLLNKDCPLASKEKITFNDLDDYTEVAHADIYAPSEKRKKSTDEKKKRKIFVFERGSQFDILSHNTRAFMWVSPIPQELLSRYGLVERSCVDNERVYKDLLIHRKNYALSKTDNLFIGELIKVKREVVKEVM